MKEKILTNQGSESIPPILQNRRNFIKTITVGGAALTVGTIFPTSLKAQTSKGEKVERSMIMVDFEKCTGCRTCETICAQYNQQVDINGEKLWGLGNPFYSNIRVYSFNPDADVPIVCLLCKDNPCIEACPVKPDEKGHRALYRDPKTLAIHSNTERCIACGSCAEACREKRVGAIIPNKKTNHPERMCTLCNGDPQCVKYCPYEALTHVKGGLDGRHYAVPAEKIAEELIHRWYGTSGLKNVPHKG